MKRQGAHISVDEVSHIYTRGSEPALKDISLEVEPGESVALLGRSGCGKSTLLHILCGLMSASRGQVRIDGARVEGPSPEWVMMFQAPSLYPWMTVEQNAGLGLRFNGRAREIPKRVPELLDLVELSAFAKRNVQDLSGGQQQRVALARSLALNPEVLLLDEPFSALDAFTRHSLQHDVTRITRDQKITLVFVTHDINEAVTMADRVIVMSPNPGRIVDDIPVGIATERHPSNPEFAEARATVVKAYETAAGLNIGDNPGIARAPLQRGRAGADGGSARHAAM